MADIVRFENEYYIRASSALADERTRVLKQGDTFAVFNRFGDIKIAGPSTLGLFHAECRHLSQFTVHVGEQQPRLLGSSIREDNAFLSVDLTNDGSDAYDLSALPPGSLHIFRQQFLRRGECYVQVRLANYGSKLANIQVCITFAADFADIFEVRGTSRERTGYRLPDEFGEDRVILAYRGLDGIVRRTHLEFSPKPVSLNAQEARFDLTLHPHEEKSIFGRVACERNSERPARLPFAAAFSKLKEPLERAPLQDCLITTSNDSFDAWLTRSAADLRTLVEGNPEGFYPYAGIPWFSTVFGRDGIITALECLWIAPSFARGILKFLAQTQATAEIPEQDAQPGKILHEMRRGEMAATKEVPFAQYYGSVDSTPLFVMLAGAYLDRTHDLSFVREIWPNVKAALCWMELHGDLDHDGFLEYEKRSARRGLGHQGWKDSQDSVFHADGQLAEPPIALCEVQGYAYAAKCAGVRLARAFNEPELGEKLGTGAQLLRSKFERAFWSEEISTFVLALDGRKRQCEVRTSNAGGALYCGMATESQARAVASSLMSADLFSGWGVRTVGAREARYNPMSYHNGSVWPHDNALIASGFGRYGLRDLAAQLLGSLYEASCHIELQRMPELFCGLHRRKDGGGPTLYPAACAPQARAAGSVFLMLSACLGINIVSEKPQIQISNPSLPAALTELRIHNLQAGEGSVDLVFQRHGNRVEAEVVDSRGHVQVRISP